MNAEFFALAFAAALNPKGHAGLNSSAPLAGLPGRVGHGVDHGGGGQDQDVVFAGGHLDPVAVPDPEPSLGNLGDLGSVALDRVLVVHEVTVGMQVRAVFEVDLPPFAQRRDQGFVYHGHPVTVWPLDLHAVPDVQHPFLDLAQLAAVHVLEQDRLAEPQRLAIELEHPLAVVVFDRVVVADGEHALAHLVARGVTVEAPFLPPSPAQQCRPLDPSPGFPPWWLMPPVSIRPAGPTSPGPGDSRPAGPTGMCAG